MHNLCIFFDFNSINLIQSILFFLALIGLLIIVLGGLLAIWFYDIYGPLSYIILFMFSLIDFVLFKFTKYLGVCYSCSSEYMNIKDVDLLPDFDHHQLEMYQK